LLLQFKQIFVPNSVRQEYERHKVNIEPDVLFLKNIKQISVESEAHKEFINEHKIEKLHQGETECLCLCQNQQIDVILTDDLAVRDAANKLDIMPVGSLGVIVKAYREKTIKLPQAEKYLLELYETSSLFVTRTIVELVIEELKKY
jgi:predicted nucleic acid-binding protein